jgi:type VI protein secretion system component VasF
MNPHDTDRQLQPLFSEQRATDAQRAPSFERTWQSVAARPAKVSWTLPVAVGACAALVALSGLMLWRPTPQPQPAGAVVASITDWVAPTDSLLETPTWSASPGTQP